MKTLEIMLNSPEYRGAPMPEWNELAVNESAFEDECRAKTWRLEACINKKDPSKSYGLVYWLSQDAERSTDRFIAEIVRAFKANGLVSGNVIGIDFGSRDTGTVEHFTMTI